jgi:hypothetical protein
MQVHESCSPFFVRFFVFYIYSFYFFPSNARIIPPAPFRAELICAVELLAPRHVVNFVGEMDADLKSVVRRVTGGTANNMWLGPMQRGPTLERILQSSEGESDEESELGGEREESRIVAEEDVSGREDSLNSQGGKGEVETRGDVGEGCAEEDVDMTPSLEKWETFIREAPPSPPLSFASSRGGDVSPLPSFPLSPGGGELRFASSQGEHQPPPLSFPSLQGGAEDDAIGTGDVERCREGGQACSGGGRRLGGALEACGDSARNTARESVHRVTRVESAQEGSIDVHQETEPCTRGQKTSQEQRGISDKDLSDENDVAGQGGALKCQGDTGEKVKAVGLPPSSRLKGGDAGAGGDVRPEEGGDSVAEASEAAQIERVDGREKRTREGRAKADDERRNSRRRSGASGCPNGAVEDKENCEVFEECEGLRTSGRRLSIAGASPKSKLVRMESPARARSKRGAIFDALARLGVAQPIPLPTWNLCERTY